MRTYTLEEQVLLLKSTVSIIGLGGLGGAVSEILARGGVGTLNIADGDCFEDSNLNRQLFSSEELLEKPKADAGAKRIKAINSSIDVNHFKTFFDEENAPEILKNADVVVDCLDNLSIRFTLEEIAKKRGIPFVSAAVAGSAGHITTIFPEDPGLELIYGNRRNVPHKGAETSLGCLPHTVTTIAAIECSEVFKVLLKNGAILKNQLLVVDLMDNMIEVYKLL
ncbi:MAG: HesA/MoeB/ThiF family protein [Desulfobacterales bacterium]|nr:HesA/MoeB/ThiF family protein [Desulfobacterales bacterium]